MSPQAQVLSALGDPQRQYRPGTGFRYTPAGYLNTVSDAAVAAAAVSDTPVSTANRPWNVSKEQEEHDELLQNHPRAAATTKRSTVGRHFEAAQINRERTARIQAKKAQYRRMITSADDHLPDGHQHSNPQAATYADPSVHHSNDNDSNSNSNYRHHHHHHRYQPRSVPRSGHADQDNTGNSADDDDDDSVMSHEQILQNGADPNNDRAAPTAVRARTARQKRLGASFASFGSAASGKPNHLLNTNASSKNSVSNKENALKPSTHLRQVRARRVREALRATHDEVDYSEALRERRQKEAKHDRMLELKRQDMERRQEAEQRRLAELERVRQASLLKQRLELEQQKRQLEQDQKMMELAAQAAKERAEQEIRLAAEATAKAKAKAQAEANKAAAAAEAAKATAQTSFFTPTPIRYKTRSFTSTESTPKIKSNLSSATNRSKNSKYQPRQRDLERNQSNEVSFSADEPTLLKDFQDLFRGYNVDVSEILNLTRCGCADLGQIDPTSQFDEDDDITVPEHDLKLSSSSASSSTKS